MKYIFIILSCLFVIGCTQKQPSITSHECLDKGGIPFIVYDSNGNVKGITCVMVSG